MDDDMFSNSISNSIRRRVVSSTRESFLRKEGFLLRAKFPDFRLEIMAGGGNLEISKLFLTGKFQKLPPILVIKEFVDQFMVQSMAGLIADEVANHLGADQP